MALQEQTVLQVHLVRQVHLVQVEVQVLQGLLVLPEVRVHQEVLDNQVKDILVLQVLLLVCLQGLIELL
jgi:hypothetical protein